MVGGDVSGHSLVFDDSGVMDEQHAVRVGVTGGTIPAGSQAVRTSLVVYGQTCDLCRDCRDGTTVLP